MSDKRECFASRVGFILLSAACAIGLGNVWRFPFIVGQYGGAIFVFIYMIFLVMLGAPIMVMEFAVGRASGQSVICSFSILEPEGTKWHLHGFIAFAGNIMLMMFYTTVSGWMLSYFWSSFHGDLTALDSAAVANYFATLLSSPVSLIFWMALAVTIGTAICYLGLQSGVEKITKYMMILMFGIILLLVVRSVTLKGAQAGLEFYLKPNLANLTNNGLWTTIYAALGQAFFTLSMGIGSLAIFGSYIGKERSLVGEAGYVIALDTLVALLAGLIIFPCCFAYRVDVGVGPGLIFVSLPIMFNHMEAGIVWSTLFFLLMSFAAMSTVIAVFENIIACIMDFWHLSRKKASILSGILIFILSFPCCLGFNVLSSIQPLGKGTCILDLEDFIVSNNMLILGSLVYLLFCTSRYGWGFKNFIKEANSGKGVKFPENKYIRIYVSYIIPFIMLIVFVWGYIEKFMK